MKAQRIAIVGAGTAGLASAVLLSRQGHQITLFERAAQLENVGAGVLLQPSGLSVFRHLGCFDAAMALGAPVSALQGQLANGSLLVDHRYQDLNTADFGLGMHRAALCAVLVGALPIRAIDWRLATAVLSLEDQPDGVLLDVQPVGGIKQTEQFDAVLIANGAKSQLRPPDWVLLDRPYPWGAIWSILPECELLDRDVLHQFYQGAHTMMGILPTGAVPDQPTQRLSSLFWSLPTAQFASWGQSPEQIAAWIDGISQTWPQAAEWLAQVVTRPEQFMRAEYRDVILSRFGVGRLGVLGDAAHAMSPQLGQGVNMALLDAWVIGRAVQQATTWGQVWPHYQQWRAPSIRFYQMMSRQLTPLYQSHRRDLGLLRDIAFPWMYRVPWLRREMAKIISGFKMGALRDLDRSVFLPNTAST